MAATAVEGQAELNPEPSQPEERAEHDLPPKSYADAVMNGENGPNHSRVEVGSGAKDHAATNGSAQPPMINGQGSRQQLDEEKVLYEKHTNHTGEILTSIKPSDGYEDSLKRRGNTTPRERKRNRPPKRQDELASGRRAGAGWQTSAYAPSRGPIRWAPLNVPLQRRLQTLAVLWHTTTIPLFLSLFFLLCAIPLTWPLLVPYLIYTLVISEEATNGTLSRRSQWMRGSKFWSLFASYFPARLHRTVELEPTRKYIFGYHPHGIISHGAFAAFATEALGFSDLYPGITNTLLTLDTNFRVPFYRDYALAMGLASVSRESIENILCKGGLNGEGMGRAVTIVIGGARESLDAKPHSLRLVLKSRKGFIKLAIRTGADLVPVLAFGENELYDQIDSVEHPWIHKFQMLVKKFMGFTVPLFHARGIFNYDVGLLPYRRAVNVVVGRPIRVVQQGTKDNNVDERYLDEVHQQYVAELVRLWDGYKDLFAQDRQGELEIVD
ncbi:Diacylglycerol O-acyltransferase 2A [Fonsecaea pedrosoi]|nr:Diacylglycerol O-acyltransferase 2A [Fonsecaea pedrosoi]